MRLGARAVVLVMLGVALCGPCVGAEPPAYPSATPVKHNSLKFCSQQADAKKLSGTARSQFIKHCQTETVSAHAATNSVTRAAQATR
jgi:hypothetical protein